MVLYIYVSFDDPKHLVAHRYRIPTFFSSIGCFASYLQSAVLSCLWGYVKVELIEKNSVRVPASIADASFRGTFGFMDNSNMRGKKSIIARPEAMSNGPRIVPHSVNDSRVLQHGG